MLRALLLLSGCCGIFPGDSCGPTGPPPPDSCNGAAAGSLGTIEIGRDDDPFSAYHDGDPPKIVRGGQGATMMGIRLRLTGSNVPACLTQTTSYQQGADGSSRSPIKTYAAGDGSFTTMPLWIPGSFPLSFGVRVDAGGQTQEVQLATPLDM